MKSIMSVPEGFRSSKYLSEKYDVSISTIRRWSWGCDRKVSIVKHRTNGNVFYKEDDVAKLAGEYVLLPAANC